MTEMTQIPYAQLPPRSKASAWNLLWAVPWGLVTWLAVEVCLFAPLYLLGLPAVLLASRWAARRQGTGIVNGALITCWANPILGAWLGNREDGISPAGYTPWTWFLRNPVCNMRFWPVISTLPSLSTRYCGTAAQIGDPGWFVVWAGGYVGFRLQRTSWGLWLGWKISPRDSNPLAPRDYRYYGLGIACQFIRF